MKWTNCGQTRAIQQVRMNYKVHKTRINKAFSHICASPKFVIFRHCPKEFGSTCFRLFPGISAPFRSKTHPFRRPYLHCFRVLRAWMWDKLWSKRYSPNTVSAVLREFFVVCMVTLSAPKVKAFRETNFAPQ